MSLQRKRSDGARRQALAGIGLAVVIVVLVHAAEAAIPGVRAVVESSYDWLQSRLTPVRGKALDSLIVVDISDIAPVPHSTDGKGELFTPRAELTRVVKRIHDGQPLAIGIDIDFALNERGEYFTSDDRAFLEMVSTLTGLGAKVFVAVGSGLGRGPSRVLANPVFGALAAYVGRPNPEGLGPNPRMDEFVDIPYIDDDDSQQSWRVKSLASSLAGARRSESRLPDWAVTSRVNSQIEVEPARIGVQQFLVDFSPIDDFAKDAVLSTVITSADFLKYQPDFFKGKIVIVGRAAKGPWPTTITDTFTVPGRRADAYPGVLLHACATYTLLGATLSEFTAWFGLLLDVVLSALVIGAVWFVTKFYNTRLISDVAVHRLNKLFTWGIVVAVVAAGVLVNLTRLMWPGFVLVAAGLLLHSSLEQDDSTLWSVLHWARKAWRAIVFHPDKGRTA